MKWIHYTGGFNNEFQIYHFWYKTWIPFPYCEFILVKKILCIVGRLILKIHSVRPKYQNFIENLSTCNNLFNVKISFIIGAKF